MRAIHSIRNLLYPPCCLFCHQTVADHSTQSACCNRCYQEIQIWPISCCRRCGCELAAELAPGPCGHCLQKPPPQQQSVSLYRYTTPVRSAILNWKLHGDDSAVRWLLHAARPRLQQIISHDSLLIPIPMPLSRMRASGQHHSANLCRWIATMCSSQWQWKLLRRQGEQARQSSLSAKARRKNLRKAFTLNHDHLPEWDETQQLWVIDDILTTGTTLNTAARVLKQTGAKVSVLSLARVTRTDALHRLNKKT